MNHLIKNGITAFIGGILWIGFTQAAIALPFVMPMSVVRPEEAGFDSKKLAQMDERILREIQAGYSGLNLLIIKNGKIAYQKAYGFSKKYEQSRLMEKPIPASTDTIYDLASNSKMYATNFALQKLVSEGLLKLDDFIVNYVPDFKDKEIDEIKGKNTLKISDLLHHNAGFPADPQYPNLSVAKNLYSQDKENTLKKIIETPLEYEPGTKNVYSDVDYMLLGFIIESIVKMPLDTYVETKIYAPLGLKNTLFNPLKKSRLKEKIAATELNGNTRDGVVYFPNIRTATIWGEVHDEKAYYSMNGVSGHAGLFSNTYDMAILLQVMLNGGTYHGVKVFNPEVVQQFVSSAASDPTYGLGWRVNGGNGFAFFGKYASSKTYGHTGWTGTFTLIDPENNMGIVLLGNRPHSPVADPIGNPNVFQSGSTKLSSYNWVVDQIYEARLPIEKE